MGRRPGGCQARADHSRTCAPTAAASPQDLGTIRLSGATSPRMAMPNPLPCVWACHSRPARAGRPDPAWHRGFLSNGPVGSLPYFLSSPPCFRVGLLSAPLSRLASPSAAPFVFTEHRSWLRATQSNIAPLNAQLASQPSRAPSLRSPTFSPEVTSDLRRDLTIVDNDIALCEKSVQEKPESEIARDYLYSAYQQKADLLAQISEHGDEGR